MKKLIGIGVAAALLVLAGCGGKDTGSADTGVGDKDVATGGRLFKTADEETAKLGSDAQPGQFPRTVKHALGETKLEKKPERAVEVSQENIGQAVGDWIFYSSYGKPDTTAENTVVNGNLWKALPAVKNGQVARVDDEVWFLGLGPLGAMDVLTDLERLLGPKG